MIGFKEYLSESIHDKGIFKAVFVIGIPGAGKSYTVSQLGGAIQPRVVNSDIATEFLIKKTGIHVDSSNYYQVKDTTVKTTKEMLTQYLNSMLPLFVDGTSKDSGSILNRQGILESFGYDTGCVYVRTSLDVAIARAEAREKAIGRGVSPDFIKKVYQVSEDNANYLKSRFNFFQVVTNDNDDMGDVEIHYVYNKVQNFYTMPLKNSYGQKIIQTLEQEHQDYLSPTIMPMDRIRQRVDSWFGS